MSTTTNNQVVCKTCGGSGLIQEPRYTQTLVHRLDCMGELYTGVDVNVTVECVACPDCDHGNERSD